MGDLREQLRKARLLSEGQARRLAHEERVRRKKAGREGLEEAQRQRGEELAGLAARGRERTKEAQQELDRRRRLAAEEAACRDILQTRSERPRGGSGERWYFERTDGTLPWLELGEEQRRSLRTGGLCVVVLGPPGAHVYGLLASDLAARLARVWPERIAWAPAGVLSTPNP